MTATAQALNVPLMKELARKWAPVGWKNPNASITRETDKHAFAKAALKAVLK